MRRVDWEMMTVQRGLRQGSRRMVTLSVLDNGYSNPDDPAGQGGIVTPTTPTDLVAVAHRRDVALRWRGNPQMTAKREFNVYRAETAGGPWTKIGTTANMHYADFGLPLGGTEAAPVDKTYYYRVSETALSGPYAGEESPPSAGVEATVSGIPTGDLVEKAITEAKLDDYSIAERALVTPLANRISLIDGDGAGSVNARIDAAVGIINSELDTINAVLADIEALPAYDSAGTYGAGDLVTYDGKLWRALQAMSDPVPTPAEGVYWEKVGDYASLGEAVAAHAVRLDAIDQDIIDIGSLVTANATDISVLEAAIYDEETGLGTKASVTQVDTAITTYDGTVAGGIAASVTGLKVDVGSLTTGLQVQGMVIDGVAANYFVKIDNNGNVAGYGLYSTAADGEVVSEFHVAVDKFTIALGDTRVAPFLITTVAGNPVLWFDGHISARTLSVLTRDLVNPVSRTEHVRGWGGVDENGTETSPINSYDSASNSMQIVNVSANASIRSQTFPVQHEQIYRVRATIRKLDAVGGQYFGLSAFTSPQVAAQSTSNGQGTESIARYNTSRTYVSDTHNAYFAGTGSAEWDWKEFEVFIIGAHRDIAECEDAVWPTTLITAHAYPYVKLYEDTTDVAIRFLNWDNGETAATVQVKDVSVEQVGQGKIVTEKLVADSIKAIHVDFESVFAEEIEVVSSGAIYAGFDVTDGTPTVGGFWLQGADGPGEQSLWIGNESKYLKYHPSTGLKYTGDLAFETLVATIEGVAPILKLDPVYGFVASEDMTTFKVRTIQSPRALALQYADPDDWQDTARVGSVLAAGDANIRTNDSVWAGGAPSVDAALGSRDNVGVGQSSYAGSGNNDLSVISHGEMGVYEIEVVSVAALPSIGSAGVGGGTVFIAHSDTGRVTEAYLSRRVSRIWGTVGLIGADSVMGKVNTDLIMDEFGTSFTYAARECDSFEVGGFSDWHLPSWEEFYLMMQVASINSWLFASAFYYWTSSEVDATTARRVEAMANPAWMGGYYGVGQDRTKSTSSASVPVRDYYLRDQFRWRVAGGAWSAPQDLASGQTVQLGAGPTIMFDSSVGHATDDTWTVEVIGKVALSLKDANGVEYVRAYDGGMWLGGEPVAVSDQSLKTTDSVTFVEIMESVLPGDTVFEEQTGVPQSTTSQDWTDLYTLSSDLMNAFLPGSIRFAYEFYMGSLGSNTWAETRVMVGGVQAGDIHENHTTTPELVVQDFPLEKDDTVVVQGRREGTLSRACVVANSRGSWNETFLKYLARSVMT